ncbi:MAG TPA: hypothetical protein VGO93_12320 [Candidatus Xenobia bacterium]
MSPDSPRAYTTRGRRGSTPEETVHRSCWCGLELTLERKASGWLVRYGCRDCHSFQDELFPGGRCTSCQVHEVMGFQDPALLTAGLNESAVDIAPSRNDFLEGLLRGLVNGEPGLTVPDAA